MTDAVDDADRYCRSCSHALRGVASGACPECGAAFDPDDPRTTWTQPFPRRHAAARLVQAGVRLQIPIALGLMAASAIGTAPLWLWLPLPLLGLLGLGCIVGAALPVLPLSPRWRAAGIALPLLVLSIPLSGWPFRVAFALHRPALDAFVQELRAGARALPTSPIRIGVYRIRTVTRTPDDAIGFQLSGHAGGGVFLVHSLPNPSRIWINANWIEPLGDDWSRVEQD